MYHVGQRDHNCVMKVRPRLFWLRLEWVPDATVVTFGRQEAEKSRYKCIVSPPANCCVVLASLPSARCVFAQAYRLQSCKESVFSTSSAFWCITRLQSFRLSIRPFSSSAVEGEAYLTVSDMSLLKPSICRGPPCFQLHSQRKPCTHKRLRCAARAEASAPRQR